MLLFLNPSLGLQLSVLFFRHAISKAEMATGWQGGGGMASSVDKQTRVH
jgi:hypothetical protein